MATFLEEPKASTSGGGGGGSRKSECMCVVCTCGLHKCPSRETNPYDPNILSEYGERYPEWPISKRLPHKPPPACKDDGPFDDNTTYKLDYGKKTMPKRAPMRPPAREQDTGPFVDATTYKVDYWDKSKEQKPARRAEKPHKVESGQFYDETTYGVGYCPKQMPKRCAPQKHGCSLGNSGAKFVDETTYNVGFQDWKVKRPVRGGPTRSAPPPQKFDGDTTYNIDFTRPPPRLVSPPRGKRKEKSIRSPTLLKRLLIKCLGLYINVRTSCVLGIDQQDLGAVQKRSYSANSYQLQWLDCGRPTTMPLALSRLYPRGLHTVNFSSMKLKNTCTKREWTLKIILNIPVDLVDCLSKLIDVKFLEQVIQRAHHESSLEFQPNQFDSPAATETYKSFLENKL
ncbi:hypothetical protein SELMODRAFT_419977 [Selaginella moellendorffii]|uniref:Uncharacterized protein n=1 Tax=Selaginella moellendorffii TaxID=88036 RepID=D8SA62_SELML|nr:hypothetical protein SELMODRAFT_419977 [Selaginella moellendorffii]